MEIIVMGHIHGQYLHQNENHLSNMWMKWMMFWCWWDGVYVCIEAEGIHVNIFCKHDIVLICLSIYHVSYWSNGSGVSTVGHSGGCAPLTFSLYILNVISNKHVAYLSCSCYMYINNLEVVVTLCSHESIFHAGHLLLAV